MPWELNRTATFRFYAELNDLLPPARRYRAFQVRFELPRSVKDMIEGLGVPHTEVDLLLINGESVGFDYLVHDGDYVSVYPVFESLDISSLVRVRPEPLRETRFVLDTHLGKLATYLRLLGFDTLYRNDYDDRELARISAEEGRILLTRDRGLLKRNRVIHGHLVRANQPRPQLREVLQRFDLYEDLDPFSRCLRCNGLLQPVAKEEVIERLEPGTRRHYDRFWRCVQCGQVYWRGPHYQRMLRFVESLEGPKRSSAP